MSKALFTSPSEGSIPGIRRSLAPPWPDTRAHFCLLAVSLAAVACSPTGDTPDSGPVAATRSQIFVDAAAETGLDFVHFNGMSGELYMAEIIAPGAALFDFDNDGDLDVYLPQGSMLGPGKTVADATFPPADPERLSDRLFRNELIGRSESGSAGALHFTDVTSASGLDTMTRYGMGVAAGDYDNDGWIDLYVTNLGPNQLLRNNGDDTFTDVTDIAGVGDPGWSVPAGFLDYDRDGWLDLFVANYVDFPFEDPVLCRDLTGARDYCGPASYPAQPDRLYRNRGDGTFEDVTARAGLKTEPRPALGVVIADLDDDGSSDIYVANDGEPNYFWANQGDGTFLDEALFAGCAVNASGKAEGSMGVDAADFDRDGDLDLFMTHLVAETNTVFVNDGQGLFSDRTSSTGLGAPSRLHTSFGTGWLDYDNDGWLDLVVVNGAVKKIEALARANDPFPMHEPNQLFRNLGDGSGRYEEVSDSAGSAFALSEVSRGAAIGDIDNDGDTDILIANNGGPVRLLLNQVGHASHWLGLELEADDKGRVLPDTRAALVHAGEPS
ncbi:MAG: VCBS repeat-containing protein, partial [Acidimicrobiia bacterium]|nr:VCBS repeat-containing protein [Acidimicrobiia bacterium]